MLHQSHRNVLDADPGFIDCQHGVIDRCDFGASGQRCESSELAVGMFGGSLAAFSSTVLQLRWIRVLFLCPVFLVWGGMISLAFRALGFASVCGRVLSQLRSIFAVGRLDSTWLQLKAHHVA